MNPILLSTLLANALDSQNARPGQARPPQRRRRKRSSRDSPRSADGTLRRILKRLARKLSLRRAVAKRTSLRCPRCNSPSLAPPKADLIALECNRCRGVWLDRADLETLIKRASHEPGFACPERVQYWEDVFSSAIRCSQHTPRVERSQVSEEA